MPLLYCAIGTHGGVRGRLSIYESLLLDFFV